MNRVQINVRIEPDLAERLDTKRIELKEKFGKIPTRSEIVRLALERFLGIQGTAAGDKEKRTS